MSELSAVVAASSMAEVCWLDPAGLPRVRGVVPLVREGRPVVAFTWANQDVAREIARAEEVVVSLSESRSTGAAFRPVVASGRPHLVEDLSGDLFVADLLTQELRKYPPARVYADSPLLMREHWWYLPRLVVEIEVDSVEPARVRGDRYDHLLVVADGGRLAVRPAGAGADAGAALAVEVPGSAPGPGPALLFGQDASFPDLERWDQWCWAGGWDGGSSLLVTERPERTGLGPAPSLLQRWRRQRSLQRHCVSALSRARA